MSTATVQKLGFRGSFTTAETVRVYHAEVEATDDGKVCLAMMHHGQARARLTIDPATAKHLAHALNVVAFAVDPEPFAIGISGGKFTQRILTSCGEWSAAEFDEAREFLKSRGQPATMSDVNEHLEFVEAGRGERPRGTGPNGTWTAEDEARMRAIADEHFRQHGGDC
jgi:hypothetical protein